MVSSWVRARWMKVLCLLVEGEPRALGPQAPNYAQQHRIPDTGVRNQEHACGPPNWAHPYCLVVCWFSGGRAQNIGPARPWSRTPAPANRSTQSGTCLWAMARRTEPTPPCLVVVRLCGGRAKNIGTTRPYPRTPAPDTGLPEDATRNIWPAKLSPPSLGGDFGPPSTRSRVNPVPKSLITARWARPRALVVSQSFVNIYKYIGVGNCFLCRWEVTIVSALIVSTPY